MQNFQLCEILNSRQIGNIALLFFCSRHIYLGNRIHILTGKPAALILVKILGNIASECAVGEIFFIDLYAKECKGKFKNKSLYKDAKRAYKAGASTFVGNNGNTEFFNNYDISKFTVSDSASKNILNPNVIAALTSRF